MRSELQAQTDTQPEVELPKLRLSQAIAREHHGRWKDAGTHTARSSGRPRRHHR